MLHRSVQENVQCWSPLYTKRNKLAGGLLSSESGVEPEDVALKNEQYGAASGHKPNEHTVSTLPLFILTNRGDKMIITQMSVYIVNF